MNLDNFEACIFDLDGTTLDSMWVWHEIDRRFLGKRGIELPSDYMKSINHLSPYQTALYTIDRFSLSDTPEELMNEWYSLAKDAYENEVQAKPFVREYIEKVHSRGLKLFVATALDKTLAKLVLSRLGLLDYFVSITSVSEVSRGKGFPDVYLKAISEYGINPTKCVVFEDILEGIKGANLGNFYTIGVYDKDSHDDREKIREIANGYIHSFEEIL